MLRRQIRSTSAALPPPRAGLQGGMHPSSTHHFIIIVGSHSCCCLSTLRHIVHADTLPRAAAKSQALLGLQPSLWRSSTFSLFTYSAQAGTQTSLAPELPSASLQSRWQLFRRAAWRHKASQDLSGTRIAHAAACAGQAARLDSPFLPVLSAGSKRHAFQAAARCKRYSRAPLFAAAARRRAAQRRPTRLRSAAGGKA